MSVAILAAAFAPGAWAGFIVNFPKEAAGVNVKFSGKQVLDGNAAIIDSVTYVSVRGFADLYGGYTVSWNDATKTATVTGNGRTVKVVTGQSYIEANGRIFYTSNPARIYDGRICVPVRPISSALGFDVEWDAGTRTVHLQKPALASAEIRYNSEPVLAFKNNQRRKRREPRGQIAVGNVIMNRTLHKDYPNTVKEVIFDTKYGVQFTRFRWEQSTTIRPK